LTGSNFNYGDNFVGGRHGYGAKLANVFSTWFCVENAATWQAGNTTQYTTVSFSPDLTHLCKEYRSDTIKENEYAFMWLDVPEDY